MTTSSKPVTSSNDVVGRDAEFARVGRFLEGIPEGPQALLLSGAAGMGKTTILRWALGEAERTGSRVLLARPGEGESLLAFAGLADLLGSVDTAAVGDVPDLQRRALDAALRRAEGDPLMDPLAIGHGVLRIVRELAHERPLLLAVDDIQWLDAPTVRVLEFIIRRLDRDPIGLIASARSGTPGAVADLVFRAISHDRVTRLDVGPLSVEDIGRLIGLRLGATPRRTVAIRIRELSGGNPLYALELARAYDRSDGGGDAQSIPVPDSLGALIRERVEQLSPAAGEVALVAATAYQPTVHLVRDALGPEFDVSAGLAEARDGGVLEERPDGRLAFSHPLLSWAVYSAASAERRLALHERLAEVVEDPDERVRHCATVTSQPDESIAAELEVVARRVRDRGAPETASDLALEAIRLTSPDAAGALRRRTVTAAEYAIQAGDSRRARELLERHIAATEPGPDRAGALNLLADIRSGDDWVAKKELLLQSLVEAAPDSIEYAEAKLMLGTVHWMLVEDIPEGIDHARDALVTATGLGEPAMVMRAATSLGFLEAFAGDLTAGLERLQGVLPLEADATETRFLFRPSYDIALLLDWADRLDEARASWLEVLERADRVGDADSRPFILADLAATELSLGDWVAASHHVDEAELAAELQGYESTRAFMAIPRVRLEAYRGDVDRARTAAASGIEHATRTRSQVLGDEIRTALAEAELSVGDHAAALAGVLPVTDRLSAAHVRHVPGFGAVPVAAEAAALTGQIGTTEELLTRLLDVGRALDHASTLRAYQRGRAQLAATHGRLDEALEAIDAAMAQASRVPDPFERARTVLVRAEILRRLRRRAPAREAANEALATFESLGARIWAERARSELARAGVPVAGQAGRNALTPTQREVASLVAAGRTNREVAEALFMSPHTVEAHLTTIYRVLGIRSRTDLARVLAAAEVMPDPSSSATED